MCVCAPENAGNRYSCVSRYIIVLVEYILFASKRRPFPSHNECAFFSFSSFRLPTHIHQRTALCMAYWMIVDDNMITRWIVHNLLNPYTWDGQNHGATQPIRCLWCGRQLWFLSTTEIWYFFLLLLLLPLFLHNVKNKRSHPIEIQMTL